VLTLLSVQIFYTICKSAADNLSSWSNSAVIFQLAVLTLTLFFLLTMLKRHTRSFVIRNDSLEVKHFFGLSSKTYELNHLKFSYYSWTTKLALLELPNGMQLTLGKSQYMNFDKMVEILKERIPNDKLKFKFVNRLTIFIAVASILFFVMIVQLGKG
jgi:hypothetical protein